MNSALIICAKKCATMGAVYTTYSLLAVQATRVTCQMSDRKMFETNVVVSIETRTHTHTHTSVKC